MKRVLIGAAIGTTSAFTTAQGSPPVKFPATSMRAPDRTRAVAHGWSETVNQLRAFSQLEDDWDGDGALAPEPALIDCAVRLSHYLEGSAIPSADRVHVGVNATIYFEWSCGPRSYDVIEVCTPHRLEYRSVVKGQLTDIQICNL